MTNPFRRFRLNTSMSTKSETSRELPELIEASDAEIQRMEAQHRLHLNGSRWPADSVRYRNARPRVW